ncbi:MAG: alpha/beta hydrolase [Pyrinomonadaceae bacterium]
MRALKLRTLRYGLAVLFVVLGASAYTPATFAQAGAPAQSSTPAPAAAQASTKSEPVVLDAPGGKLHGTLELPAAGRAPYPVVLIIAGSGPTDRNGNTPLLPGSNNSLRYLAEGLAAAGVASLRFDKRGVAESVMAAKSESDLRFDTYIEDAVLWGQRLRADRRFSALVVAGHSEGSLIGAVAAQRLRADAFVSIAGAGRRIDAVILEQVKPQFTPEQYAKTEATLKSLAEGKTVPDVPANDILFRPSVQPYIISWLKYDPAKEVAKLSMPVLVAQGTHDVQASPEDAKGLAAAKPGAKFVMVEGMNHLLKLTPADPKQQAASYSDPALPVAPKFLAEVVAFVKGLKK